MDFNWYEHFYIYTLQIRIIFQKHILLKRIRVNLNLQIYIYTLNICNLINLRKILVFHYFLFSFSFSFSFFCFFSCRRRWWGGCNAEMEDKIISSDADGASLAIFIKQKTYKSSRIIWSKCSTLSVAYVLCWESRTCWILKTSMTAISFDQRQCNAIIV